MWSDDVIDGAGVKLAVRDYGGTGRDILFVHGGPGQNLATWDTFVPFLGGRLRAVALDMRGNGASEDADDYSHEALASDIAAAVDHFKLRQPVVVGHSWGGVLAVAYAAYHENCGGIVCVDGWVTDVVDRATDETWSWVEREYRAWPFFSFAGTRQDLNRALALVSLYDGESAAAVLDRQMHVCDDGLYRWRRSVDELLAVERAVEAAPGLSTDAYARIRCPVLLIGGEHSAAERDPRAGEWAFSRAATEPVVRRFDHVRSLWWPCGHDIPHLMPERLADTILDFVQTTFR